YRPIHEGKYDLQREPGRSSLHAHVYHALSFQPVRAGIDQRAATRRYCACQTEGSIYGKEACPRSDPGRRITQGDRTGHTEDGTRKALWYQPGNGLSIRKTIHYRLRLTLPDRISHTDQRLIPKRFAISRC